MPKEENKNLGIRQPVVAVLGHVDHGKSSLLDFIRKSNVVEGEVGGITQRISAYEIEHKDNSGKTRTITFLDTPGHEAFQSMRERGVEIADIAILVVSAEDGVKAQTLEAWKTIDEKKLPYVIAINKIDKPNADIQKTKNSLVENGIYIEGMGGDIPFTEVSAKTGQGIDNLIETLLLLADIHDFKVDLSKPASGYVLESFVDQKRGISATLIIKEGKLPAQGAIVSGISLSPIRIVEDFLGKPVKEAEAGRPIKVTGFDEIPSAGNTFVSSKDKKEMEKIQSEAKENLHKETIDPKVYRDAKVVIPVIVKADSLGTLEAVKRELKKKETDDIKVKIVGEGVGPISESDIRQAASDEKAVVIGFTVKIEPNAQDQAQRYGMTPQIFDIIYKLSEWFDTLVQDRLPFIERETVTGTLKILKTFSSSKDVHVVGGKVETGVIKVNSLVKISRRGFELGRGRIIELQSQKIKAQEVQAGTECGLMIESKTEIIPSDLVEAILIEKVKI